MTPRERFLARLHQQPADRPAVGNATSIATVELMDATGCAFPEAHLDPHLMAGLAAAGHDILGYDTIAPVYSIQHEAAALGRRVDWGRRDLMPDVVGERLTRAEDIHIPDDFLSHEACRVVLEALRILRRQYPDVALIGKTFGPWTLAYHLFGVEAFLILTLDDPAQVREIMRRLKEVAVIFATAQFEVGADAVTVGDHATGDLVSGRMYREFLWPVHCELARRIPGPVLLHICGDTADRLADIATTGFTCFHFDSKVPAQRAREIVAAKMGTGPKMGTGSPFPAVSEMGACPHLPITLMGNINNPRTLLNGTPADVAAEVEECLRQGVEIIAPECAVPLTTPTVNLQAVAQAAWG
jgi:MtaA/CmuA family methyltransferase